MGGKVQKEKVKEKPKLEEFKNSPSTKSMPLSSGIFTQNLIRILETAHEYQEIAVIGTRSEGKTWITSHHILPIVHKNKKEQYLWIRRYPDDSRHSLLDYFKTRVSEYCEWNNISVKEQERLWEVIVRGTFCEKNNSIIFAELEHWNKARGGFSKNPTLIVFDEAIPRMLDWKSGYLTNEPTKFSDLWKSMWRNKEFPKPTILHLSNAYDRTYHRLADWDEEIDEIADQELWKKGDYEDWYWEKEKEVFCEDTQKMVKKRLVFFRKKGDQEGWPVFFTKKGDFNVQKVEPKDLIPLEMYNNKYLLSRSKNRTYTLHLDYSENFPNKKKMVDYHFDSKTFFLTPPSPWKELLEPKLSKSKKNEWTDWINTKVLFFNNFEIRNEIIELLS